MLAGPAGAQQRGWPVEPRPVLPAQPGALWLPGKRGSTCAGPAMPALDPCCIAVMLSSNESLMPQWRACAALSCSGSPRTPAHCAPVRQLIPPTPLSQTQPPCLLNPMQNYERDASSDLKKAIWQVWGAHAAFPGPSGRGGVCQPAARVTLAALCAARNAPPPWCFTCCAGVGQRGQVPRGGWGLLGLRAWLAADTQPCGWESWQGASDRL